MRYDWFLINEIRVITLWLPMLAPTSTSNVLIGQYGAGTQKLANISDVKAVVGVILIGNYGLMIVFERLCLRILEVKLW